MTTTTIRAKKNTPRQTSSVRSPRKTPHPSIVKVFVSGLAPLAVITSAAEMLSSYADKLTKKSPATTLMPRDASYTKDLLEDIDRVRLDERIETSSSESGTDFSSMRCGLLRFTSLTCSFSFVQTLRDHAIGIELSSVDNSATSCTLAVQVCVDTHRRPTIHRTHP